MPFYASDESDELRKKVALLEAENKKLRSDLSLENENLIRKSERQHCAAIVRSFFITPWFLGSDGKGYKDDERARVENEKLEKIALAVEKG